MTLTALRKVLIGVGTVLLSSQGAYKGVDASDDGVPVKEGNAEFKCPGRRELNGEDAAQQPPQSPAPSSSEDMTTALTPPLVR